MAATAILNSVYRS